MHAILGMERLERIRAASRKWASWGMKTATRTRRGEVEEEGEEEAEKEEEEAESNRGGTFAGEPGSSARIVGLGPAARRP